MTVHVKGTPSASKPRIQRTACGSTLGMYSATSLDRNLITCLRCRASLPGSKLEFLRRHFDFLDQTIQHFDGPAKLCDPEVRELRIADVRRALELVQAWDDPVED